jgi:hypothetical protein
MDKLEKKIKEGIKNLKPKAKIIFIIENFFWWWLYLIFTLLWAKAFWLLLFIIFEADFLGYHMWPGKFWLFIRTFPLFWFISFLLFLSLAFIYTKHTNNAYKFGYFKIISSSIIISILLWSIFHISGIAMKEDNLIRWKMPFYDRIIPKCEWKWTNIEDWKLMWIIDEISENIVKIKDRKWNIWIINTKNVEDNKIKLKKWIMIRVIWDKKWENEFEAKTFLPPCKPKQPRIR